MDKKGQETVLVFDLGGGTFDVSVLEVGDGVVEVRATSGDGHLGRRRLRQADRRLARRRVQARPGDRPALTTRRRCSGSTRPRSARRSSCRRTTQTQINLPFVTADASGPKHLNLSLTRSKFEQLTQELVERTRGPVEQALSDAKLSADDIDEVILVGGSTRIPAVQELVRRLTERQGAEHDRQPRRGGGDRRRAAGGRAEGRGRGRRAARRHAAVARAGDARRRDDEGDRAQHDDPGPAYGDVLDRRGQPDRGRHRGAAGRARARRRQPPARPLPARGHPARAARRSADRGHVRHRRERDPQRLGA